MPRVETLGPIRFKPVFFERVWGGQKLASLYGKNIPAGRSIGESWEIVDRADAQSIVQSGPLAGRSLHDLWVDRRIDIFGRAPDAPRFPLLVKLLDCRDKLSVQVHPPAAVAASLCGEPKTECWYIADALPEAELYLGLREPVAPERFRQAIAGGTVADLIQRVSVKAGDAFFIPSGRIHAIGGGNLIVEIQQNSDTTFRVFDWNRRNQDGRSRELHIDQALKCIDFNDCEARPLVPDGEKVVSDELFAVDRWELDKVRELAPAGEFAIAFCVSGSISCRDAQFRPGDFFFLPAAAGTRMIEPVAANSSLLRITIQ